MWQSRHSEVNVYFLAWCEQTDGLFTFNGSHRSYMICNCHQYPCLFHIVFEFSSKYTLSRKHVGSPKSNFFIEYFPHRINVLFLSSRFLCHPHTQIRIILFHGVRTSMPNWKPSPNRASKRFSQIASPVTVLPKNDRIGFRSTRTTRSSILDHDLGHLCRGRRIQMSGHSDFGTFNKFGASLIFTWVLAGIASAACPAHPWQSGYDIHDSCCCHL